MRRWEVQSTVNRNVSYLAKNVWDFKQQLVAKNKLWYGSAINYSSGIDKVGFCAVCAVRQHVSQTPVCIVKTNKG